jgi:hypothetical protein
MAAESSNEMGYIVGAVPHRLTDTIVTSRSALPREQLTIRKATYTKVQGGRSVRCVCPAAVTKKYRATTAIRQIPRQREHGVEVPSAQCRYFGTAVIRISAFKQRSS